MFTTYPKKLGPPNDVAGCVLPNANRDAAELGSAVNIGCCGNPVGVWCTTLNVDDEISFDALVYTSSNDKIKVISVMTVGKKEGKRF